MGSEGAESASEKCRALESSDAQAYRFGEGGFVALAERNRKAGNPGLAAEAYRVLTQVQPSSLRARLELAKLYQATDRPAVAVAEYRLAPAQLDLLAGTYVEVGRAVGTAAGQLGRKGMLRGGALRRRGKPCCAALGRSGS